MNRILPFKIAVFIQRCTQEKARDAEDTSGIGLGGRVVKELTATLKRKYHHVFIDNYFSSPQLLHQLVDCGIYACGTVRTNRKGLPEVHVLPQ